KVNVDGVFIKITFGKGFFPLIVGLCGLYIFIIISVLQNQGKGVAPLFTCEFPLCCLYDDKITIGAFSVFSMDNYIIQILTAIATLFFDFNVEHFPYLTELPFRNNHGRLELRNVSS